jgi:hypothetical protein
VVEYDSIIPPGREGKITPEVDVSGMHGGDFKKVITIISNADNDPTFKVTIAGKVRPILSNEPNYLRVNSDGTRDNAAEVKLKTEKADLEIKEIVFVTTTGGGPEWQAQLPMYLDHSMKRSEKPDKEGYYEYTLKLWMQTPKKEFQHGEYIIRTNHPEKFEIKIRGILETAKPN